MSDSYDCESSKYSDSNCTVVYVANDLYDILRDMKIPNTVRQKANDLLIQEGFYALADVDNVSQATWDGFIDQFVDDAALFTVFSDRR